MNKIIDYTMYLCTDRDLMSCDSIETLVEQAIKGGVTVVQLREKNCTSREFYNIAVRVKKITDENNVALIINDRADIALAVDCDGVHVGQKDLPCENLRKVMGNKIIGVSVATEQEAIKAVADGADYLGVGAMFATNTKTDTRSVSKSELEKIRKAVDVPIVIIGGINKETMMNFKDMGIDGLAIVSAITSQPDIEKATEELCKLWNNGKSL